MRCSPVLPVGGGGGLARRLLLALRFGLALLLLRRPMIVIVISCGEGDLVDLCGQRVGLFDFLVLSPSLSFLSFEESSSLCGKTSRTWSQMSIASCRLA